MHQPESDGSVHVSIFFFHSAKRGAQAGSSPQSLKNVSRMAGHSIAGKAVQAGTSGGSVQALRSQSNGNSKAALLFQTGFVDGILVSAFIGPLRLSHRILILLGIGWIFHGLVEVVIS